MSGAERIVVAFSPLGESGQPAASAQSANAVAPTGQDLVRVGLMADVPDQAIARGVENVVQGGRQLDDAEAGAKVSAGDRDGVNGLLTELIGDLPDLLHLEPAQILRGPNRVEKRRFAKSGHSDIPILHVGTNRPT